MGLLREWFGPGREEVWRQLCERIGAEYVDGGFWNGDQVEARYRQWTITLDTYTVSSKDSSTTYTRIRAPFVNADGFRFSFYRRSIFTGLGKLFGMQDIEIGDGFFDDEFVIQANCEVRVRELLASERVKGLIEAQPGIHFEVKDDDGWFGRDFPEGVDELYFSTTGVITDLSRLQKLFELFAEILDELCRMGSAYEDDPVM